MNQNKYNYWQNDGLNKNHPSLTHVCVHFINKPQGSKKYLENYVEILIKLLIN